jgi:hypothetical protein
MIIKSSVGEYGICTTGFHKVIMNIVARKVHQPKMVSLEAPIFFCPLKVEGK